MAEVLKEQEEKSGSGKAIIVIVLIILMIPVVTVGILYAASDDFRRSTNEVLTVLPGSAGAYFRSLPNPEDQEVLKREIARHYITMDADRIADKLLIIRSEDEKLYQEIVLLMNRENPRKMADVNEKIQRALVRDDTLQRILEEVEQEKTARTSQLSAYLSSMTDPEAISELERMVGNNDIRIEELGHLFIQLPQEKAAAYLRYASDSLNQQVRNQLPATVQMQLDQEITTLLNRERRLIELAELYEKKVKDELVPILTTTDEHRIQDLAVIYHQMTLNKAGNILARTDNSDFKKQLYEEMKTQEALVLTRENRTRQLAEAVSLYQEYHQRVRELAAVYQRMEMNELAPLVERMLVSNTIVKQHIFSPDEQIVITEEQLVIDVLNQMRPVTISELLGQMSAPRAVLLSQKLYGE